MISFRTLRTSTIQALRFSAKVSIELARQRSAKKSRPLLHNNYHQIIQSAREIDNIADEVFCFEYGGTGARRILENQIASNLANEAYQYFGHS